jgi:acetolactate synthase-1/2/3 large subunit
VLLRLAEECRSAPEPRPQPPASRLPDVVDGRLAAGRDVDAFPVAPPRALWELRDALRPGDIRVFVVNLHKPWIARMFSAQLPIDYAVDVAISDELGEESVIRT